jgi:hypothetical protein
MKGSTRRFLQSVLIIFLVVGLSFHFQKALAKNKDHYLNLQLFAKVMNLVQQYYVEEVDTKKLNIRGN